MDLALNLAAMTVHVGPYEFDHVSYDKDGDVLYLRRGPERSAADTFGTPEGHAVRWTSTSRSLASRSSTPSGCRSATADSKSRCPASWKQILATSPRRWP